MVALYSAAAAIRATGDAPPVDVDRLLKGPDHKDFPWQVWAAAPYLTVQQRFLVVVRATINCGRLQNRALRRDLHFVVKVGNADSRWVPDYSYTRVPVPSGLDKAFQIQYVDGVYLRPGRYVIAIIVYDDLLKKQNVWRKFLTVDRVKQDPLPEIDRNLPDVEFIAEAVETYFHKGYFEYDSGWRLSQGREWLPVKNNRHLCVDVVANTSVDSDYNPVFRRDAPSSQILKISSVLSHLDLRNGRVRITILDALRMKTLFYREDTAGFDWRGASRRVAGQNPNTIDAGLLAPEARNYDYLFDTLGKILKDDACAPETKSPLKIIIIVSGSMQLPERAHVRQAIPQTILQIPATVRFFGFLRSDPMYDDLTRMMKQIKPEPQIFSDWYPLSFRKALAFLISSLENLN